MKCKCGYENKDEDLVCGMCGEPLNKQDDDEEGEQEESSVEEDGKGNGKEDEKEDEASEKADSSGWGTSEHTEVIKRGSAAVNPVKVGGAAGALMSGKNILIVAGGVIVLIIIILLASGGKEEEKKPSAFDRKEEEKKTSVTKADKPSVKKEDAWTLFENKKYGYSFECPAKTSVTEYDSESKQFDIAFRVDCRGYDNFVVNGYLYKGRRLETFINENRNVLVMITEMPSDGPFVKKSGSITQICKWAEFRGEEALWFEIKRKDTLSDLFIYQEGVTFIVKFDDDRNVEKALKIMKSFKYTDTKSRGK